MQYLSALGVRATYTYRSEENHVKFEGHDGVLMDIASPSGSTYNHLGNPDVLLHLAWGGLPNYKSNHHLNEELPLQYRFLSELVNQGLKSLVVTGTCFEYGMQEGALCANSQTNPSNSYGFAKDSLCKQLLSLKLKKHFNFTWARLFYMYGSGQSETSLFPSLVRSVQNGDSKFRMSSGEQIRDFLPVEEVAKRLVNIALKIPNTGVVNICSGNPISVKGLVEGWLSEYDWNIDIEYGVYAIPDYEPLAFWGVDEKSAIDLE